MGMMIDSETISVDIFIDKNKKNDAFHQLKKGILEKNDISSRISLEEVNNSKTFYDLMEALRWKVICNNDGDIIGLRHIWDKVAEEDLLFSLLSPYVKEGSYIEYQRDGYINTIKVKFDFTKGSVHRTVWTLEYNDQTSKDEFLLNENDTEWL